MVSFLIILLVSSSEQQLESRLITPSGTLERYVSRTDERDFSVKLIHSDGKTEWLELAPLKLFSSDEKIKRRKTSESDEEVIIESFGESRTLGISPRIFEKLGDKKSQDEFECEAIARIEFPTALSEPTDILFSKLKCLEKVPQTQISNLKVTGRANKSWTSCDPNEKYCVWNPRANIEAEANAQVSALAFLVTAQNALAFQNLKPGMGPLMAKSWSTNANKSSYDANRRLLNYGAGNYLDARDGFVVVHEWGHAVIDDLNPGLFGFEATALHEALADFIATDIFDSPCFAPFDAQEVANRKCIRDLTTEKKYPNDFEGDDPHSDSLILSGALWHTRHLLKQNLTLEISLESLIRSPKELTLKSFWSKFMQVYERILVERPTLTNYKDELKQIGLKHGLN